VRTRVARASADTPDRSALPPLLEMLHDTAWEVRAQAAKTLGQRGDAAAVEPLTRRLTDLSWWVRYNSAGALAALERMASGASPRGAVAGSLRPRYLPANVGRARPRGDTGNDA